MPCSCSVRGSGSARDSINPLFRANTGPARLLLPSQGAWLSEPMVSCSVILAENDRLILMENSPRSILTETLTLTDADKVSGILRNDSYSIFTYTMTVRLTSALMIAKSTEP